MHLSIMKTFKHSLIAALGGVVLISASASAEMTIISPQSMGNLASLLSSGPIDAQGLDWKVGDSTDYKVTVSMGITGTMHKEVTKDEGNSLWFSQQLNLVIGKDNSEVQIEKATGKILKIIRNGQEEKIPDSELEIIETKNDVVTVPAGKFKVLYVHARTKDVPKIELWANQREIAMDGAAKTAIDQGNLKLTMELTKFTKQK